MIRFRQWLVFGMMMCFSVVRAGLSPELRAEAEEATRKGVAWLKTQQKDEGYFGYKMAPALTGLAATAFILSGEEDSEETRKAIDWIKTMSQKDGGIYSKGIMGVGGGRHVYNTSICLTALHYSGREDVQDVMLNARRYIAAAQQTGDTAHKGGFSYEATGKKPHADLSNTARALEAMALTRSLEDLREGERVEIDRQAAADYVTKLQHLESSNTEGWVMTDEANKGGFAYENPNEPATKLSRREKERLASYGTMTYAGVLSLIYADVDRTDRRVRAAMEWAVRYWSAEENPGKGLEGYYYYLNIMSKCLQANGQETLTQEDGTVIQWREALVRKLVDLQRDGDKDGQGYWENDNNRYWEGNPMLVTSYVLSALQILLAE